MKTFSHLWQYLPEFVLKWKIFWTKAIEKVKIHILRSVAFYAIMSRSIVAPDRPQTAIWRRVGCWIRKATRAESRFSARTPTNTHPHTHKQARTRKHSQFTHAPHAHTEVCNTYCFFTATMVLWTCLGVTLYVHCLYCSTLKLLNTNKYTTYI